MVIVCTEALLHGLVSKVVQDDELETEVSKVMMTLVTVAI